MKTTLLLNALLLAGLGVAASQKCGDEGPDGPITSICGSCNSFITCDGTVAGEPEACEEEGNKFCVINPATGNAGCGPEESSADDACKCGGSDNKQTCDFYDEKTIRVCNAGTVFPVPCLGDNDVCIVDDVNPDMKKCDEKPIGSIECTKPGKYFTTNDKCTSVAYCTGTTPMFPYTCEEGKIFDEAQQKCVTPPFEPCTGYCVDGFCADVSDCKKRQLCIDGMFVKSYDCTTSKQYFNYETSACEANQDGCHPLTKCGVTSSGSTGENSEQGSGETSESGSGENSETGSGENSETGSGENSETGSGENSETGSGENSETGSGENSESGSGGNSESGSGETSEPEVTAPPSSACSPNTAYKIWPDPADCRRYYRCLPTESGSYAMAQGKCSGRLEFNSAKNQCDLKGKGDCPKN